MLLLFRFAFFSDIDSKYPPPFPVFSCDLFRASPPPHAKQKPSEYARPLQFPPALPLCPSGITSLVLHISLSANKLIIPAIEHGL